jgi:hypothetical protein
VPVATQYTEGAFAEYLVSVLDGLASTLDWNSGDPRVQEALADALLEYGDTTIGNISGTDNLRKLRALGRRAIWRAVVQASVGHYSFTDVAQQKFSREQVNEQARKMLELAELDCRAAGADAGYAVSLVSISRPHDPYAVIPDEERVP